MEWKHVKNPNPIDVPLTAKIYERGDYTCWVDNKTKTINWVKKIQYIESKKDKGKILKKRGVKKTTQKLWKDLGNNESK